MPRIKVTGYIDIEDDQFDPGPLGPLTAAAYDSIMGLDGMNPTTLADLEDPDFETTEESTDE